MRPWPPPKTLWTSANQVIRGCKVCSVKGFILALRAVAGGGPWWSVLRSSKRPAQTHPCPTQPNQTSSIPFCNSSPLKDPPASPKACASSSMRPCSRSVLPSSRTSLTSVVKRVWDLPRPQAQDPQHPRGGRPAPHPPGARRHRFLSLRPRKRRPQRAGPHAGHGGTDRRGMARR